MSDFLVQSTIHFLAGVGAVVVLCAVGVAWLAVTVRQEGEVDRAWRRAAKKARRALDPEVDDG